MPCRNALHPGYPWVKPCASKSDCFRCTLFDGPASAGGLARGASSSSGLRSRRSPMCRSAASCLCPGRSRGQTGTRMMSSGLAHLSDTGLLQIVRAGKPLAMKMYSLDFIKKPTNMPDSNLSSAFVRSVHGPNQYHTRSQNTHLPMSATSPPCERCVPVGPNRAQVQNRGGVPTYPSNGLRFQWYLHLAVELKFILECPEHATHQPHCSSWPIHFQRDRTAQMFPKWLRVQPFLHLLLLRRPASLLVLHRGVWSPVSSPARPLTLPASRLHARVRRPSLSTVIAKTIRTSLATQIGVPSPLRWPQQMHASGN